MLNMLANPVPQCWPDPSALYCSGSDQSSSFASSTQPSPAIVKPEVDYGKKTIAFGIVQTKPMARPQLAAICIAGSQPQQQHHLANFVQSAFSTNFSAGVVERARPVKRKPRPVPDDEKRTEV